MHFSIMHVITHMQYNMCVCVGVCVCSVRMDMSVRVHTQTVGAFARAYSTRRTSLKYKYVCKSGAQEIAEKRKICE